MLRAASMQTATVVLGTVLTVLAVVGLGALLRRRGVVGEGGGATLGRLVADVTFPALCLDGLARGDADALRRGAPIAMLGLGGLAVAAVVGVAVVRALGVPERSRATAVFAIAIGNWIFLPLPVADALFGERGVATVILNNVGAQLFLWTLGIAILRGRMDAGAASAIVRSPGLWATLAGVTCALVPRGALGGAEAAVGVVGEAVHMVASLTIPLVSIAIGAQLAEGSRGDVSTRALSAVVAGRMLLAPVAAIGALALAERLGLVLHGAERTTEQLIQVMPVSLSAAALVQRYGGDSALVSRAILVTSLLAVVTTPVWMLVLGG